MHIAWQGALIGLAIGVFLVLMEYIFVKRAVEERAQLKHQKPEFDQTDRNRIKSVFRFSLLLPLAFAAGAWLLGNFIS